MSAHLFIRNDDVWTLDRKFCFFFDLAIDHGIPVVHAVIPGKMDRGLVRFLCRAKVKTPQLLDIVQHGWVHANHSLEAGTKYEFGVTRSLALQRENIQQGLKKMRMAFGECFTSAFVPPYHGYDQRTLQALYGEGFQIFSGANHRLEGKKRFMEIPVQVSFSRYEKGQKSMCTARELVTNLVKVINRRLLTGVLVHHEDFATTALRKELTRFFDSVAALRVKEGWQVLLFSDILSGTKRIKERS